MSSVRWVVLTFAVAVFGGPFVNAMRADDAREAAVHRPRRLIFNNDGDDALHYSMYQEGPASKEGLLDIRMDHIDGCGVDCVFYCTTQSFNYFTHDSKISEVFTTKEGAFKNNRTAELIAQGTDPLQVMIEACRQRKLEIIYTIRMNDIHDNFWGEMVSQWKKDHPQMLMGKPEDKTKYPDTDPRHVWTFADFSHQEVRDRMVVVIKDVLDRYDVDGIDLDCLRHPAFFKESLVYQPATDEHLDMLTDMVRKIRSEVLEASKRKEKPILLSVRILPTLESNRRLGVDVERWIKDDLVDFISVGGGYDPFTMPAKDMIDHGHASGIPVYVCLSTSGFSDAALAVKHAKVEDNIESWRAAAANAWCSGADGIMTFNLFPHRTGTKVTNHVRQVWKDICNPETLVGKDKLYIIENLKIFGETCYMVGSVPIDGRLPIEVKKGSTAERVLPVADDVASLKDHLQALHLRICVSGLSEGGRISVSINGTSLDLVAKKEGWWATDVPPKAMQQGDNTLIVAYEDGQPNSINWDAAELVVTYNPAFPR